MNYDNINQQINTLLPMVGDGDWQNTSTIGPNGEFILKLSKPGSSFEFEADLSKDTRPIHEILKVFNDYLGRMKS